MTTQGLRTHHCGELRASDADSAVQLSGWVASHRDLGALVFIDLRDRYGITQLSFDEDTPRELLAAAQRLKAESVIHVKGTVRRRLEANAERATGEIEVLVQDLEVLGPAKTPPFEIDADRVSDELRLTYRYLDLRREAPSAALAMRHTVFLALRNGLDAQGFLEIETPILTKATPEGARDYLVPSRVHPGKVFALPQSPQIFKQILMVAGMDKYFQITRCFRDEDLRADRQPEFTQLDVEMSFVDEAAVQAVIDRAVSGAVEAVQPGRCPPTPFPSMTWTEAMERFGSDKPDLRFGVELADVSKLVSGCGFGVFEKAVEAGGRVRVLAAPGGAKLSRKEITGLEGVAKEYGAKGLAWAKVVESEDAASAGPVLSGGISKFLDPALQNALMEACGASVGDALFFGADSFRVSAAALSAVRLALGKKLELIDRSRFEFVWITEFPMFDQDEESGALTPAHHPFCMPLEAHEGQLAEDPAQTLARSYDLVLNGVELGSGSVRIHDAAMQRRVFEAIGLPDEEIEERFGFVIHAFEYGAPPHAGFAVGLDRLVMLLAGEDSIREVIAFPKTAQATCLMTGAPTEVPEEQLLEAGVKSAGQSAQGGELAGDQVTEVGS
jgi:aspartyl-tRNA synthetase